MLKGAAHDAHFTVNGRDYKFPYYLTDEVYLTYATTLKAIRLQTDRKKKCLQKTGIDREGCGACFGRQSGTLLKMRHVHMTSKTYDIFIMHAT